MRKLLLIGALIGGISPAVFSQGRVNFVAGAAAITRIATNSTFGGPSTGLISGSAGSYYFVLFVAPTSTGTNYSLSSSLDPTQNGFALVNSPGGAYGTNSGLGRFSGNPTGTDPLTINGYPSDYVADFVVVGWSANIAGPNWNAFRAWWNDGNINGPVGWAGHSFVASNVYGVGEIVGNIFGNQLPGQIPGFTLGMIPEPSALALAGLACASATIFRRPKAETGSSSNVN